MLYSLLGPVTRRCHCGTLCLLLLAAPAVLTAQAHGWRTDGSGQYPVAEPPLVWSDRQGVVWKTPLVGESNATPVICGDRIFVCAEPTTLLCINKRDGTVVWQHSHQLLDLLPAQEAARARQLIVATAQEQRRIGQVKAELSALHHRLRTRPDDRDLQRKIAALRDRFSSLRAQLDEVTPYLDPPCHHDVGYATPTPVCDGKRVCALFGNGVAACYDLSGDRLWVRHIERPQHSWGVSGSPLSSRGKLYVHIVDLVALDAATGRQVWRIKSGSRWGSPIFLSIAGQEVIVTPGGDWVRAADGRMLASATAFLDYCAPVADGTTGTVYFIQHGGRALQIPAAIPPHGELEPVVRWQTSPPRDRYYASPVVHRGHIYAVTRFGRLSVIDAATGEVVRDVQLDLGRKTYYASLVVAGGYLFVSRDSGDTLVLEPAPELREVARNSLEPFRSTPVFEGRRMYVRARSHLYCIGR